MIVIERDDMTTYIKIAAAAIIRYEFEKKYRRLYNECTGQPCKIPFGLMLKVLVKHKLIEKNQVHSLSKRYKWLSEMIHADRKVVTNERVAASAA